MSDLKTCIGCGVSQDALADACVVCVLVERVNRLLERLVVAERRGHVAQLEAENARLLGLLRRAWIIRHNWTAEFDMDVRSALGMEEER